MGVPKYKSYMCATCNIASLVQSKSHPGWSSNIAWWQDKNSPKLLRRPRWMDIHPIRFCTRPSVGSSKLLRTTRGITISPRSEPPALSASLFETRNIINSCIKRSSFSAFRITRPGPFDCALWAPSVSPTLNGPSTSDSCRPLRRLGDPDFLCPRPPSPSSLYKWCLASPAQPKRPHHSSFQWSVSLSLRCGGDGDGDLFGAHRCFA